ncbi:TM0106 family RecB-like putative nuclease [Cyanobium sp. Alchichica 3B3-8F6]|uniref:TM0106 family RecB-like putative nuclease n=1 Tax=Cyanobium sp. Alchichica 3B3-8F6 TaxID=2823696 RepID=UPI0020CDE1A7|nr:TM0106 family RecB-like putative nuclease [Cyanobium sp. Alchichica 3B3-8F6]MCP9883335.1 TM0106 family RecB-like putative nuclease [Cyanobium sp. Alchichica 3B3-8F6]
MSNRLITPSQLALFSRSPVIGAWWEEVHATTPDRAPRPATKALEQLLFDAGLEHEKILIAELRRDGKTIAELRGKQEQEDYDATLEAMRSGVDYIWQASLRNNEMRGSADLLERIERPSSLGAWSYIPIECKLSSHSKPIYLVQACAYCELLEPILGQRPEDFKLYLGKRRFEPYASDQFWSWYEQLRQRYRDFRAAFDPNQQPEHAPGDHGLWEPFIQERLEAKRDLTLVAGMRQSQRRKLLASSITTIDALAAWPDDKPVSGLDPAMLARLRDQARIQIATESRTDDRPAHRVRPLEQQSRGLAMLPAPDAGDIWFDMEGFPNPVSGEKLEYLFGACYRDEQGELKFADWWAHSPDEEKQAFDDFVQWVQQRRERHPNLHVYHYASYEKTALGNLASLHQIHQAEIDQWLRDELLVDLYTIVRNGLLVGAPSYSIKKVERLYGGPRDEEVENAADSVVQYAQWLKTGDPQILKDLYKYNEKDCQVTEGLHRFLLDLPEKQPIPPRANKWGTAATDAAEEKATTAYQKDLELAGRELLQELPATLDNEEAQGPRGLSWRLQRLIGQLIDFQEREGKVEWWEFFHRLQMTPEEREDDSEVIAGARLESVEAITNQSNGYRYRFDAEQPLKLSAKASFNPQFAVVPLQRDGERLLPLPHLIKEEKKALGLEGVLDDDRPDEVMLRLSHKLLAELKEGGLHGGDLPRQADLVPLPKQIYKRMLGHLVRLAQGWVFERKPLPEPLLHLLERRPIPELPALNQRIRQAPGTAAQELAAYLADADGMGLSLQGPPGTGKTTVTGELIATLVQGGNRVVVSSTTNEAINNVLRKVQECLDQNGSSALVVKASSTSSHKADMASLGGSKAQALKEADLPPKPEVLGATVYTLVKDTYDGAPFDLLVIDEAGQVTLSNLLYLSRVARNILLVGDQQQLSQPNRAKHPGESGLSCLDYVMAHHAVVPQDRGVFLATSWRMPPALTQVVSELFYDGELQASNANSANTVQWAGQAQGLLYEAVPHSGNSTVSDEEVEHIAALVEQLHGKPYWRARLVNGQLKTVEGVLTGKDILITAPYNMQVNRLQKRLGNKARIGTVDKFQGQEAPVAIHSLTASDGESAPRGLDFLLEPNRMNVAISRAQCLSIVVGSPELATGISTSIANVQRLNRLCRLMAVGQGEER